MNMKLALIFCTVLLSFSCATQAQKSRLAAPNMVAASEVEGLAFKHRGVNMTVMGNVTVTRRAIGDSIVQPMLLGRVGHFDISRTDSASRSRAQPNAASNDSQLIAVAAPTPIQNEASFVGIIYQNESQEMGLIGKEITLKFKANRVPVQYQSLNIKPLIAGQSIYVMTVKNLAEWLALLPQLEADPEVSLVEAQIVTQFKQPR